MTQQNEKIGLLAATSLIIGNMIGAGILDGDILIVDRSLEPIHNNIVIWRNLWSHG